MIILIQNVFHCFSLTFFWKKKRYYDICFVIPVSIPKTLRLIITFFISEWSSNWITTTLKKIRLNLTLTHKWPCPTRSNHWILQKLAIIGYNFITGVWILLIYTKLFERIPMKIPNKILPWFINYLEL